MKLRGGSAAAALQRESRGEVDDVADEVRRRVGGPCDLEAAARVPDEHVPRLEYGRHRVQSGRHRRGLGGALAVPGHIDRYGAVAEPLQFRDRAVPAPCTVEAPVDQDESHLEDPPTRRPG
jgi:hypothetical protein